MSKYAILIILFISFCMPVYGGEKEKADSKEDIIIPPYYRGKKMKFWMEALQQRSDYNIRKLAVQVLRKSADVVLPELIKNLKSKDENVRQGAAAGLGVFGDKAAIPALIKALKDHHASKNIPVIINTSLDITQKEIKELNGKIHSLVEKGISSKAELLTEIRKIEKMQVNEERRIDNGGYSNSIGY